MPAKKRTTQSEVEVRARSTASKFMGEGEPLHETVAVSDAVFAAANFFAVSHLWSSNPLAALGFSFVGFAASFGVLRFGFSPATFAGVNGHLAETSAFVGLPLVGISTLWTAKQSPLTRAIPTDKLPAAHTFIVALVIAHGIIRGFVQEMDARNKFKVPFNVLFFVGPIAAACFGGAQPDWQMLAGVIGFVIVGAVIGADRDRLLFNIRRENWFHYGLAAATVVIAMGMRRIVA